MNELRVEGLTRYYGKKCALKDFTYTFTDGVYGLLGPNGAGKSTMMHILTDNLRADCGEILFQGENKRKLGDEYRACLGYVPQQQRVYDGMTLERYLFYMASLKGLKRSDAAEQIERILPTVNLADERKMKLGGFSGGMRQRALIAQAVLGDPKILILDEPTAGLDPKERVRIRNLIAEISFRRIVIIATHIVTDVEMIAKEVIFLDHGTISRSGNIQDICDSLYGKAFYVMADIAEWEQVSKKYNVSQICREGEQVRLKVISDTPPQECSETAPVTLEDLYLYLYGSEG